MKQKEFIPQITDVRILDYPVLAGSGNIGIKAKVLDEERLTTIGLDQEIAWRKASDAEKPIIAMGIAASIFRFEILRKIDMKSSALQSPSELMYHQWDRLGRQTKGVENEMGITDRKLFGHNDEVELSFDVHDGFAVAELEDKEYVMFYPTIHQVSFSEKMQEKIEWYVGQPVRDTGICPHDIALTYGEIKKVNKLLVDLEWNAERTIHQNLQIKQDMLDIMLADNGIVNELKFPKLINGRIKAGYIIIDDDNRVTEFRVAPDYYANQKEKDAFYRKFPDDVRLQSVFNMYDDWKMKVMEGRVSDVTFRQGPRNPVYLSISCKIDGEQQISRQMTQHDSNLYRQLEDKESYYGKQLLGGFVVNYFRDSLFKDQSRNQGMKR